MKLKFVGDPNQDDFVNNNGSHCFTSGKVYNAEPSLWGVDRPGDDEVDVTDDQGDVWLVCISDGDFEVVK